MSIAGPGHRKSTSRSELEGDPVSGGGSYRATAAGAETDVALHVRVEGGGPMAPMWEAMGGPMLPKFARLFGEQLRDRIEQIAGEATLAEVTAARPGLWARFVAWFRRLFGG